jgi:hypothetical protein
MAWARRENDSSLDDPIDSSADGHGGRPKGRRLPKTMPCGASNENLTKIVQYTRPVHQVLVL